MHQPIPESEFQIDFARSGGKGGQNVNKVETKVILRWNVGQSLAFSDAEKARIRARLANRLTQADDIVIAVDAERSQVENKIEAIARLQALVTRALVVPKKRRATKPSAAAKEKRLEKKKKHSAAKRARSSPVATEEM